MNTTIAWRNQPPPRGGGHGVRRLGVVALFLVAGVLAGCASGAAPPPATDVGGGEAAIGSGRVVLVSLDGFRYDYLDPTTTPNLLALAERGVMAEWMIPSFPTKTFPNHYTIVTGLRPDHHGLVANNMWDPDMQARYRLGDREAVQNAEWYGGVPIWVTAERHGMATAPMFWPGSEAPIGDVRATYWKAYDGEMAHRARVDWVVSRLVGSEGPPARFATLYFSDVDDAGHVHGPGAPETRAASARVDSAIGYLRERLDAHGLTDVDVIVVSDHGMSQLSRDRVIFLDDYIDPETTRVVDWNPVLALWPAPAAVDSIYRALHGRHPHLHVHRPEEIPDQYRFGTHDRVAPIIGIADPGWSITTRDYFDRNPARFDGGNHGYYQQAEEMRALFVAAGPAFRSGEMIPPFPNVDVYELVMAILGLPPEPGDGRLERVEAALRLDPARRPDGS